MSFVDLLNLDADRPDQIDSSPSACVDHDNDEAARAWRKKLLVLNERLDESFGAVIDRVATPRRGSAGINVEDIIDLLVAAKNEAYNAICCPCSMTDGRGALLKTVGALRRAQALSTVADSAGLSIEARRRLRGELLTFRAAFTNAVDAAYRGSFGSGPSTLHCYDTIDLDNLRLACRAATINRERLIGDATPDPQSSNDTTVASPERTLAAA